MVVNLPNTLLKLGLALAKHHAKNLIGDEALEVFTTTLTDINGENLQVRIDSILASQEGQKELLEAAKKADQSFRDKCEDKDMLGLFTMEHGDLPSVQVAIASLPKALNDEVLRGTLFKVFRAELPKRVNDEQVNDGVNLYIECLRDALLPVKDFGLHILYGELKEIGKDVKDIKALLLEKTKSDLQGADSRLTVDYKKQFLDSLPGSYITPDLIMPYKETSNEVIVGRTINIDHIRDQRFMLRKEILDNVLNELDLF